MPTCHQCREQADELTTNDVRGKARAICEACAEEARQADELSLAAEAAMRGVLEYKGG